MAASSDRSTDRSTSCTHFSNLVTSCANQSARPRWRSRVPGVLALLLAGAISIHPVRAYAQGIFVPNAGSMNTARASATMTVLQNGQVLIAGGQANGVVLASAELYDPNTGTFSVTGSMNSTRYVDTATLLPNGQVLITGGQNSSGATLATAELYNPATGMFSLTGSMNTARENHTATLLQNGQVLVAAGNNSSGIVASAELYDPNTGLFTVTGSMNTGRYVPMAALLPNGQVLVAGGITNPNPSYVATAELYNPATGKFSYTGSMSTARGYFTLTALQNGQVLAAGGYNGSAQVLTAELYNPTAGTFSLTGSMTNQQGGPATLLGNGEVLIAGGYNGGSLATAEVYGPATGTFGLTGSMTTARNAPAAALLPNGQVLVAGGQDSSGAALASAELYLPGNFTSVIITGSGTVQDNQGIINCTATNGTQSGTCRTIYSVAETVTMTATPAAGLTFGGWTTTGTPTCVPSGNTCSFTIPAGAFGNSIGASFFGPATMLAFSVPPPNAAQGNAIAPAPTVRVEDADGNVVASGPASTAAISIAIGTNPSGGTLSGITTVSAVNGVATFSGLAIDNPGSGYTLTASSTGLTPATSGSFNVNSLNAGRVNEVDLGAQSGTLDSGTAGSATYLVTVTYTIPQSHGGGKGTATLSVNTSLPAGVSVSFDPPSLYFCCDPGTYQLPSTLTISTSAGTPPGETHFIAAATSDYGGEAIADGTLAVGVGGTITGSGSSANVCPNGQTTPAPCSAPITVQFLSVPPGTTFGANSVQVVTQGTPNLDFTLASTTCTGSPTSCTVNVTFAPLAPGLRLGAVNLSDSSGNFLGSSLISGIGNGPAIAFAPGVQTTVGSGWSYPTGVAVDSAGDVFIADPVNSQVVKVTPTGVQTTVGSGLSSPYGVAVDGAGDVFIADPGIPAVVEVTPSGVQTTVGSGLSYPQGVAVDGAGDVFIADPGIPAVVEVTPSGVQTVVPATGLSYPQGVAVDGAGDVFIADPGIPAVVEVTPSGVQTTVGSGLSYPYGVAVDGAGDVFIADYFNQQVVEVTPSGVQTMVPATGLAGPTTVGVDGAGDVFIAYPDNQQVVEVTPSGVQTTVPAAGLGYPIGVAVDAAGDVFIADSNNSRVVELQRSQAPSLTFASTNVGSTSTDSPQSITAQNIGNQALNAVAPGLVVTGPDFVQVPGTGTPADCTASFALAPGASCNLSLSFQPQSPGSLTSTVVFSDNALNTSPSATQSIALAGMATGVVVAPVVGLTQAAATSAINGVGLTVTTSSAPSSTVPIGNVISESPSAGTTVGVGSAVNLVISTGVAVPNVVGQSQATATSAINGAGLTVTTSSASSSTVPIGNVISESPVAGTAVNGGSAVNLVISTGVTVPNVVGQMQAAATSALNGAGLVLGTVTTASSSTVPSGSVISENPSAGTPVNGGSAVALVVSTGPAQYLLTTAANPPSGGTVSPATGNQNANAVVALKATASAGYVFSGWTGPVANPTSASTTVTMGGPESVTANFISALTVAPSSIAFGTVYLGSLTSKNITLTNTGTTPIAITSPFLSIVQGGNSEEFVAINLCPASLAAGSQCTISITFVAGPFYTPQTATLSIMDNAPGNPQTVMLTATVINPQASFNPTSLSFGNQTVNTSVTKTVTLKNTGTTTLSLTGMTVTGTNAAQFTLTPSSSCGSSLTAGSSCTISVTFKPVAKVAYSASLNVTDNAQSGTQKVPLSGTGH